MRPVNTMVALGAAAIIFTSYSFSSGAHAQSPGGKGFEHRSIAEQHRGIGPEKAKLPFKPDPARGHETAMKLCAGCHIVDRGQVKTAQPGVPTFHFMADKPGQTKKNLADNMIHPFPPMVDTHLTMHEIKDITAYILSLKSSKQD